MRRPFVPIALLPGLVVAAVVLASDGDASRLTYRFDEVKNKVLVAAASAPETERRVVAGETAASGDHVRTGFWGRAVVSVPERKARFEIASGTSAVLAGNEPGVLLTLEKGRLKAIFEAITGGPPQERRVAAPGALLSVRGTRDRPPRRHGRGSGNGTAAPATQLVALNLGSGAQAWSTPIDGMINDLQATSTGLLGVVSKYVAPTGTETHGTVSRSLVSINLAGGIVWTLALD